MEAPERIGAAGKKSVLLHFLGEGYAEGKKGVCGD